MTGSALDAAIRTATPDRIEDPRGFDAIVVGAGAAGGMASMCLTQSGLSVLVMDAGYRAPFWRAPLRRITSAVVRRVADPRLQAVLPPRIVALGRRGLQLAGKIRQPVQTRCFAWALAPESFVDDRDNPYLIEPGSRFDWFQVQQIGGRMIVPGHGRQYYRLGERDFAPADGLSPRWPLEPGELDPWYDRVEALLGMSGGGEQCPWIPDTRTTRMLAPSPAEADLIDRVTRRWPGARPILGRSAAPMDGLMAAAATGRLSCRSGAAVTRILVDAGGRTTGVAFHDRSTGRTGRARAPLVFLCAASLATTRILLNTDLPGKPGGIGAASDALGRYLMDHVVVSGEGSGGPLPDEPVDAEPGRCVYLPRFDLRDGAREAAGRGYGVQLYRWSTGRGSSYANAVSFAEMTPRADNRVVLDPRRRDAWGQRVLRIACRHNDAEIAMAADQSAGLRAIGEALDIRYVRLDERPAPPGTAIHECGTARMGTSPDTAVLDPYNQCWDAQGLYVTDASAFPSQGAQNPTLTILALTARACRHAVGSFPA